MSNSKNNTNTVSTADIILKSNAIFTSTSKEPFPGAVAVKGNRIIGVWADGEDCGERIDCEDREGAARYIGDSTKVMEFGDRLIMPGFVDGHVHYFMGAVAASPRMCTELFESKSEDDCVRMIKEFAESRPDDERIIGSGWFPVNWGDAPLPTKHSLDKAVPDRPVYLMAADMHTMWLNSMALEEAGIRSDMTLKSGEVGVLENGELSGILFEIEAMRPGFEKAFNFELPVLKEMHREFLKQITAQGVTSISDMTANDYDEEMRRNCRAIKALEEDGDLICRIHIYPRLEGLRDFSQAKKLEQEYGSEKLKITGVKGFIDGVASTYTAYLLEPYTDRPDTTGIGTPLIAYESLRDSVVAANKQGLSVRLHCIGDASIRMGLDVYEESIKVNGRHGLPNTIEHIETIHPDDIPRFKELDVIPSMQPYHLIMDGDEKICRMGKERSRWEWPHKSLLESGAKLAFSTDYPVVDFNPFPNLYAAVARRDIEGKPAGVNPEECIDLASALIAYTAGSAAAYRRQDEIGTLEEGKLADIVVLDRNLFDVAEEEIKDASVELTMVDGKIVYHR